jgi:hypothetical protein
MVSNPGARPSFQIPARGHGFKSARAAGLNNFAAGAKAKGRDA